MCNMLYYQSSYTLYWQDFSFRVVIYYSESTLLIYRKGDNMIQKLKFLISKGLRKFLNPPAIRDCTLADPVAIWNDSSINNTKIGRFTYVSDHTVISHTEIGAFCSIAGHCMIGAAGHPIDFASTSPVFLSGRNAFGKHLAQVEYEPFCQTVIGNDVWIGAHTLIKPGVAIADGAIVGMGSVVTKDIGPYEIWAGNPARLIRKRFDDDTVKALQSSRWWELPEDALRSIGQHIQDPATFAAMAAKLHADEK